MPFLAYVVSFTEFTFRCRFGICCPVLLNLHLDAVFGICCFLLCGLCKVNITCPVDRSFWNFLSSSSLVSSKPCSLIFFLSHQNGSNFHLQWLFTRVSHSYPHIIIKRSKEVECSSHVIFSMFFHELSRNPVPIKLFISWAVVMHELLLPHWLYVKSVVPLLVACQ